MLPTITWPQSKVRETSIPLNKLKSDQISRRRTRFSALKTKKALIKSKIKLANSLVNKISRKIIFWTM